MNELFLLKLGEIVLKGLNRRSFEQQLQSNLRRRLRSCGEFSVRTVQSTVYVEPKDDACDLDAAWEICRSIFGVVSCCRCRAAEKSLDAIYALARDYLGPELSLARSFKVESKRSDKRFPYNSIQISQEVGGRLAEEFPNVRVDVHRPEYTVSRCARRRPMSTARPSRARAVFRPGRPGARPCCSPAASTRPSRVI